MDGWKVRVQYISKRGPSHLEFGPMSWTKAVAEGERHAREGRSARLIDPDGKMSPVVALGPVGRRRQRRPLDDVAQLPLFGDSKGGSNGSRNRSG